MEEIHFFVPGIPAPGGSKRFVGFAKKTGRAILVDDAGEKNKNWRQSVATFAYMEKQKRGMTTLITQPIHVRMEFIMPRPKAHFRTGKHANEIRPDAPTWHTKKPDALKLARSTEDAMTGVLYEDDAATCKIEAFKRYGNGPGCFITIQDPI